VSEVVLDASALLAYLNEESGAEAVEQALPNGAYISAVNWAEVLSKVAESGGEPEVLISDLEVCAFWDRPLRCCLFYQRMAQPLPACVL
jgi:PIN domain nuclease of toxin-antitoxin system